jgi:hypothetical protein
MSRVRLFLFSLLAFLTQIPAFAAETQGPDMASDLRSSGKIYVVVLVLATIFAGILAFLIYLERRVNRLEQEIQQKD